MFNLLRQRVHPARHTVFALALLVLCLAPATVPAEENNSTTEYRVKTAFLYNFARFSNWPSTIEDNFRLCIIGDSPFGDLVDSLIGRMVHNNVLVVDYYDNLDSVSECHLAYISISLEPGLDGILYHLRDLPVLTVSDIEGFALRGGIINFTLINNKVRFVINTEAAGYAGITISSKLLSLATIVETEQ